MFVRAWGTPAPLLGSPASQHLCTYSSATAWGCVGSCGVRPPWDACSYQESGGRIRFVVYMWCACVCWGSGGAPPIRPFTTPTPPRSHTKEVPCVRFPSMLVGRTSPSVQVEVHTVSAESA
jgi:hypothetical protein